MSRPRNEGESRVQSFRREWGYPHHDDGDDDDDHDDGDDDVHHENLVASVS